jgi:predicted esterase YcpF (UPF0227 family)
MTTTPQATDTPKILFLHGFTSGGRCEIAQTLRQEFRDTAELICPDLQLHPYEALKQTRAICQKTHPDLIVGSSCGAFYAQQLVNLEHIPAVLVNPFFRMSDFLKDRIGIRPYKCTREDGQQQYEVNSELIEEFKQMEKEQFNSYNPSNKDKVWGLFGTQDTLAHYKDTFNKYYNVSRSFEGGHTMPPDNVRTYLTPTIKEMLAKIITK